MIVFKAVRPLAAIVGLAVAGAWAPAALAQGDAPQSPSTAGPAQAPVWSVGLFGGKLYKDNLLDLIPHAVSGDLRDQNSYISGLVVRRSLDNPGWVQAWGEWGGMPVFTGLEFGAFHRNGLLHSDELVAGWRLGATGVQWQGLKIDVAGSFGLSHALNHPPYDNPNHADEKNYATLFYMAPEIALRHDALPGWSLALRIHHRSGIYGLVAPSHVGSNHVGLLLTREF